MLKKYSDKTSALFKNGFKDENVPEEFKFNVNAK